MSSISSAATNSNAAHPMIVLLEKLHNEELTVQVALFRQECGALLTRTQQIGWGRLVHALSPRNSVLDKIRAAVRWIFCQLSSSFRSESEKQTFLQKEKDRTGSEISQIPSAIGQEETTFVSKLNQIQCKKQEFEKLKTRFSGEFLLEVRKEELSEDEQQKGDLLQSVWNRLKKPIAIGCYAHPSKGEQPFVMVYLKKSDAARTERQVVVYAREESGAWNVEYELYDPAQDGKESVAVESNAIQKPVISSQAVIDDQEKFNELRQLLATGKTNTGWELTAPTLSV